MKMDKELRQTIQTAFLGRVCNFEFQQGIIKNYSKILVLCHKKNLQVRKQCS